MFSNYFSDNIFKHLFESEINPDDAKEAYSILENYYKYGTPDNPEQKHG